jgi:Ca-activated chloride channel family protein
MTFAYPGYLWLLLIIPPTLGLFFWWSATARRKLMTQFIQARLLPGLISGVSPTRERFRAVGLIAAAVCLILALARPQLGYELEEVRQRGLDIVVAIDTSKSMLAEDISPNRLSRAKLAAVDLMQQAKSDRLGLVAFAGNAFLQCPLTIDDVAFRQSVESLNVGTMSEGGTALSEAINTALTAFKEGDNYKVLVLFSDGEDHDSGALDAARKASEAGLRIFTIGIGSADGELLHIRGPNGQPDFIRDGDGNVVKSRLNEGLLRDIATAANGFYVPLRGATTVDVLYQKGLAPLPKSDSQEKWLKRPRERYQWPLAAAIVLLIGEIFFPERTRTPRQAAGTLARRTAGTVAAWLLLFLAHAASASPSSALREYQSGNYSDALKDFQSSLQKKPHDLRLQFNAGAAAYRLGEFDQARKYFEETVNAQDLNLQQQAYYNLGNTLYRLGERASDPQKKTEPWELALKQYDSAIKLNTNDADAKFNREFVSKRLEELKQQKQQQQKPNGVQPSEDAKKAKAAADEAVRRKEYVAALQIMETQLQRDPTTAYYQDYIQRLKDITGVQENDHH